MRNINFLVIHCSATDNPDQDDIQFVRELHTSPKDKKFKWGKYDTYGKAWSDVGYHYYITKRGHIQIGRPLHRPGAHAKGFNNTSIGICLAGDKSFNKIQFEMASILCQGLIQRYSLEKKDIIGHRDLTKYKTCPNFKVEEKIIPLIQII